MRADGRYLAVATWGEDGSVDGVPTVVVMAASPAGTNGAASAPIFSYVTPGSMFAVDVVVTSTSASTDTLIVAAAGEGWHDCLLMSFDNPSVCLLLSSPLHR